MSAAVPGKSSFQRLVFWLSALGAIGTTLSLGENLFVGLLWINWIIDTWHSFFAPAIVWLNEYVFSWINITLVQVKVDFFVILSVMMRLVYSEISVVPPPFRKKARIAWAIYYVFCTVVLLIATPDSDTLTDHQTRYILGVNLVLLAIFLSGGKLLHSKGSISLAKVFLAVTIYLMMGFLHDFNAHADQNLPYIERWLQAWDDAVTEQLERPMNED